MYTETIWRNCDKKSKLVAKKVLKVKFGDIRNSSDLFGYVIRPKVYSNYVIKTIFHSLKKKSMTKSKEVYNINELIKCQVSHLEFKSGFMGLEKNFETGGSKKQKIEKISQKRANFTFYKVLKLNNNLLKSNKKRIFEKINIMSNNKKISLYCFVLKIIFV
jgi:hypothetical protein